MNSTAKKPQPTSAQHPSQIAQSSLMAHDERRSISIVDRTYRQLRSLPRQMRRFLRRKFGMSLARVALALALSGTPISSVVQAQHLLDPARAADERVPSAGIIVDGTDCTLIEAIESANNNDADGNGCENGSGDDTITLQADVTLDAVNNNTNGPNGLPNITSKITIEGAGHTIERQSSAPDFRIFHVSSSGDLTLNETTVSGGSLANNGGGILNRGDMNINHSTISGNYSIGVGGGVLNRKDMNINHSTISGNNSGNAGGGIYNDGDMNINHSTISGNNSGNAGGGMHNNDDMNINHSIISGNYSRNDGTEISNRVSINGNSNLFGDSSKSSSQAFFAFTPGTNDINATSDGRNTPLSEILDTTLRDNGGPTLTHALVSGSPAIDAASNSGETTDQRGVARPQGADDDIGAFEYGPPEIDVEGNSTSIADGENTPSSDDHTDFGEADVSGGTKSRTFTIKNRGFTNLTLDSVSITGAEAGDFSLTTPSSPVVVGKTSQFTVEFDPSATGTRTATIEIKNSDSDEGTYTFAIQGTGSQPPQPTPVPSQPPQVNTPFPDITVASGAGEQIINPFDYISDPEGDRIFFHVTGNSNSAVVPNLPAGLQLGNIDQMPIQFGEPGQTEITIQAKEMWSHATVEDTFSVTVLERPKISISKSVSDQTVSAGQAITYTIAITNSGPSTVTNALISDLLPTDITFVASSIRASGIKSGTIGSTPPTLASGVTITPSQKIELSFVALVDQQALGNQAITNSVQLTATEVITPAQALNLITLLPPQLTISDLTVSEADASATFRVQLERASALPVTVEYTTVAGSATEEDYTPSNGTLTIAAGQTEGQITVQITDDELVEEAETFTVELSNPSHATISDGEAVATINDNDDAPTDADADGVNNEIEDQVPNPNGKGSGDGNADGIPDSQQHHVASLPNGSTEEYVTFVAPNDQSLHDVHSINLPADAPPEATFSRGIFTFGITGLTNGASSSIRLILHSSDSESLPNSYWKYGPTPDNPTDHWYNFTFDGTTGAQIEGNTITLHFVDGQRGDSDLGANGQISDPGGPALYQPPTALTISHIDTPSPTERYAGALLALLIASGLLLAIRRK